MAHVKDDADASVSKDSVFDWGGGSSKEGRSNSECSGPSSRYDPKAMSRIVDITDLVDDDDIDSDDEDNVVPAVGSSGGKQPKFGGKRSPGYGPGGVGTVALFRQAIILVAIVGVIVAASLAIGYAVIGADPEASSAAVGGGAAALPSSRKEERREQELLELAERIVTACAESRLDSDMKECQKLCKKNMCCFEGGDYSCAHDERRDCAVYAGCQALVEGVPVGGADEKDE